MNYTKNIALKEVLENLNTDSKSESMLLFLKENEVENEDVKGIKEYLKLHNWDVNALNRFLEQSASRFDAIQASPPKKKKNYTLLKVAAVFIPLLIIGTVWYQFDKTITGKKQEVSLYTHYYEKEIGLPVIMSSQTEKHFNESMNAFKDGDFKEALVGFSLIQKNKPENDTLFYFMACSNLELGNLSEAINQFQSISSGSIFKEKSDYRLALAYLKKDDFKNTEIVLKTILSNPEHSYFSKAKELSAEEVFN